ncbi:LAFE_0D02806g1_1 [Lachancea fermentati]|uniref:LAFE_0D02806g1_1 n=1 Tax=Lachancea fermentati TaxID=4955 RepID=A0A1G4MAX1_LACFM|nr:LAFE_0D02806g1_1 [Lachancea fermentati]
MEPANILLRLVALMLLIFPTNAFYFYSNGGERKCFHKELSKGTLIQGKYDVQTYDDSADGYRPATPNELNVVIDIEEVFDDNHRVSNQKGSPTGDFTFIALESGEHKICLQPQAQGWLAKVKTRINIDFEIGSESKLDTKKKSAVQSLQNKVQILNEKVEEIRREQDLVRDREAMFRDASESANSRAMWWTIIQIIVLSVTCAWQLRHLRTFFVKQKIL